jgi:hypothetical protein
MIRRLAPGDDDGVSEQTVGNVSLTGVYFETDAAHPYAVNELVIASVSIPEAQRRFFPFTRVAGRSRIVRVDALPAESDRPKRFGIALEFGNDVTALTAIPDR